MQPQTVKPSSEILTRINKDSLNHKDEVFTRLYRYLLREDVYIAAFQNLYANDGALTPGINDDTASGFGMEYIRDIIEELRNGTYRPTPVKRVYIPKKNGKFRPLGLPPFRDKLLQEVVRMYLEAIYEPLFDSHSHGFRPNRSCHTALKQIQKEFNGVPWIIEGDIAHCFDSIDHRLMIKILGKKIKDQRFLNVIWLFLKSGYVDDWVYHETYSGAAQGGVISPILMNIYMNEFDMKMTELGEDMEKTSPVKENPMTNDYKILTNRINYLHKKIADLELNAPERSTLIKEVKQLKHERLQAPATANITKKMKFIRYADDWVVGVWGTKADCVRLKNSIGDFLSTKLKLTLSEEKTLITHSSEKIRFLGYDFHVSRKQEAKGVMVTGKNIVKRTMSKKLILSTPLQDKIVSFLKSKMVVKIDDDGKMIPIARTKLMNCTPEQIINTYNSETRGILNFYALSGNFDKLDYFVYLMEYSCLATLARKFNISTREVIHKYSYKGSWAIPYTTKAGKTKYIQFVTITGYTKPKVNNVDRINNFVPYRMKEIGSRIRKNICEICKVPAENDRSCKVLVVKRLKLLGNQPWERLMKQMHRKTLIVCPTCFKMIQESRCVR